VDRSRTPLVLTWQIFRVRPGYAGHYAAHAMVCRTSKLATILSTVMLGIASLLFLLGFFLNPWDHHLSCGEKFHVAVWNRGLDSRLVFFNNAQYGPYRGSLLGILDAEGNVYPKRKWEQSFGDSWGAYYRYFQWTDATLWTLMISLWYPISAFAIIPAKRVLDLTYQSRR
jgi:hypothetical protein